MTSTDTLYTSLSLLARAKGGDADAWILMTDLYGPLVYRWARGAGLQDCDAADILQDVFRDVAQGLHRFRKERPQDTFRGWLWVITRNRLRRYYQAAQSRPAAIGGSEANQIIQSIPDGFVTDDEPNEQEGTADLLHRALDLIRGDFSEKTWQACWRLTVAGHSAAEVGRDLGMTEKAVRQAKYRILCRLRQVLRDD